MRLGLIINPVAGIGGAVGLKGSDGFEIQLKALSLGAKPQSPLRAAKALEVLLPLRDQFELIVPPGEMGETVSQDLGFKPHVIDQNRKKITSAEDTIQAARAMNDLSVDLLLFAGGDGTARDIFIAVGTSLTVLGIPAGVKIHSAVFATHPRTAGEIASAYVRREKLSIREAEVVDLDEGAYRTGVVSTRLFGYLRVPNLAQHLQNKKAPTPASETRRAEAIAVAVIESMQPHQLYIVGPGTTTRTIAEKLGFPKTLVGVDVYTRNNVVALDVSESVLLKLLESHKAKIIVAPIGGQGFIFGRGNQQISPQVMQRVGRENLIIVSLVEKLNALRNAPLLVDTGDSSVDQMLTGYWPILVGYNEKVIYRVEAP